MAVEYILKKSFDPAAFPGEAGSLPAGQAGGSAGKISIRLTL